MPYIKGNILRRLLNRIIEENKGVLTEKGAINYFLCKFGKENCKDYEDWRAYIGEIECAKLEMYRRWFGTYEDKKKEENGDI